MTMKLISLADIDLDLANYRIGKQASQVEATTAIVEEQGDKLVHLAKDILEFGVNPSDIPILYLNENDRYTVLEGNRRVLTLQMLNEPDRAKGTPLEREFKQLHKAFQAKPITALNCVIAESRAAGLVWVERKHGSGLDGAGTEQWKALAKQRFDLELGGSKPGLAVLEFVLSNSDETDPIIAEAVESGKYPITNLDRLVGNDDFKSALGLTIEDGKVKSTRPAKWLLKTLKKVVDMIGTGKTPEGEDFNVRSIYTGEQRKIFAEKLVNDDPPSKSVDSWGLDEFATQTKPATQQTKKTGTRSTPSAQDRATLIPSTTKIKILSGKPNELYTNLKRLKIEGHSVLIGIGLRVFIEMSTDYYVREFKLYTPEQLDSQPKFANKLKAVADHMVQQKVLNKNQVKVIVVDDPASFLHANTMHAYVHNMTYCPTPESLKLTWDSLEQVVIKMWEEIVKSRAGQP